MSLPLMQYKPSAQNQRVDSYEVPGDEQPRIYSTNNLLSPGEMDALIIAAYRQIFHEQQMTASSRQLALESQLRAKQITVKQFIEGLATSAHFRSYNYDTNSNYRFVQMCIQRILGRDVYDEREKLAWSIVVATKGIKGFIEQLLNSKEYLENFGESTVPYQRRRILPQHAQGDLPFARMARYDEYYRDKQPRRKVSFLDNQFEPFDWEIFVKETNWSVVSGLALGAVSVIFFLLAIASFAG